MPNTNMESFRGLDVNAGFKLVSPKPLDVRSVVKNATQLQEIIDSGAAYPGLQVWVKDLTGTEYTSHRVYYNGSAFVEIVDGAGGDAYVKESTYEGSSLTAIMAAHPNPNNGDIAIVKEEIGSNTGKYSYTAYFYDSTLTTPAWVAMDGNYDAENIYFDEDFTVTEKIGTIQTLTNGSATLAAQGRNLKQVLATLLATEKQPSVTQPAVSITFASAGAYEVGTVVSTSYSASLSAGSYTYGPATGITPSSWTVTDGNTTLTTATGSFGDVTVAENTNYHITATASYEAGAYANTNLGNTSTTRVAAGSKSKTSGNITGFYACFYGYKTNNSTTPTALTSAQVRALGSGVQQSLPSTMTTTNMQQMYFAAKAGRYTSVAVSDSTNGAPQTVRSTTATVKDAGGNDVTYDIFYVNNAAADGATITWNISAT